VQGVELEDLHAGVEIAGCVCAGGFRWGGAANVAIGTGTPEAVGDVEVGSAGGGEIVLEALLVEVLCSCVGK
jgi:hypothetical protein